MNEFNLIYDYKQEIQCVKNVHRWIAYESRQNFVLYRMFVLPKNV